ncbi:MAG: hypothetical protein AAGA96_06945 [Verrucomicrobiota bacterium]
MKHKGFRLSLMLMMVAMWALATMALEAHRVSSVSLISYFDTEEGTYLLDAAMEVIPSDEQELNDQISPEDAARQFAEEYLAVMFDDVEQFPELTMELINASDEETPESLQRQELLVKFVGKIPEGAQDFMLYLDPNSPMAVVMVVVKDDQPSRRMQVILAGEFSRKVNVQPVVEGNPFDPSPSDSAEVDPGSSTGMPSGDSSRKDDDGVRTSIDKMALGPFSAGWVSVFGGSLLLTLIPISIFLLTTKGRAMIYQVAAYLVGQSLTVSLAIWQIRLTSLPLELLLGLCLVLVAAEALFHERLKWWRFAGLFLAGLLAGALIANSPEFYQVFSAQLTPSMGRMLLFVTGSELATVVFCSLSAGVCLLVSRFPWYRSSFVQPLAVVMAGYGIYEVASTFW